jgi:Kef-type K+ transport system membrane component KefB
MGELPLTDPVLQFTVLVTLAWVVQRTFVHLHLPRVVGLLLAGMLLGPGGLAVLPREPVVSLLGEIGLVYLMFVAGAEVDLDVIRARKRETLGFGVLGFVLSLALGVVGGLLLLDLSLRGALLLGTLVSSHTLLAYPIVVDLRLVQRAPVVAAIGGTLVTDTLALLLLAGVLESGGEEPWLELALTVAALGALTGVSLAVLPRLSRYFFERPDVRMAEKALYVLAVLLLLATAAEAIGTEPILGAFLAGVCLNRPLREREALREHVEFAGRLLFVPFFFISTGMLLELEVLGRGGRLWAVAGILLGVVVVGKTIAAWVTGALAGWSKRARLLVASLTFPQAAATLAVTITAREAGLFSLQLVDGVILLIFATCTAGPLLTRFFGKRLHEQDPAEDRHVSLERPPTTSSPSSA